MSVLSHFLGLCNFSLINVDQTLNRDINKLFLFGYSWATSAQVIKLLKSAKRKVLFNKHHGIQIFYCSSFHIKWRKRQAPAGSYRTDVPGIVRKRQVLFYYRTLRPPKGWKWQYLASSDSAKCLLMKGEGGYTYE